MQPIISITGLGKVYASGFEALKGVDLAIRPGEIFALLGPNGAGTTTLINIVGGTVNPSSGPGLADGHATWAAARAQLPQTGPGRRGRPLQGCRGGRRGRPASPGPPPTMPESRSATS